MINVYRRKYDKHIKLRESTKNRKLFIYFINLLSNQVSNKKIEHWVQLHYHKTIYPSSIGLARRKIATAKSCRLSVLELFRGKIGRPKQLQRVSPWNVLMNELARINRAILTGTETNGDKRELPTLLHLCKSRAWLE